MPPAPARARSSAAPTAAQRDRAPVLVWGNVARSGATRGRSECVQGTRMWMGVGRASQPVACLVRGALPPTTREGNSSPISLASKCPSARLRRSSSACWAGTRPGRVEGVRWARPCGPGGSCPRAPATPTAGASLWPAGARASAAAPAAYAGAHGAASARHAAGRRASSDTEPTPASRSAAVSAAAIVEVCAARFALIFFTATTVVGTLPVARAAPCEIPHAPPSVVAAGSTSACACRARGGGGAASGRRRGWRPQAFLASLCCGECEPSRRFPSARCCAVRQ